MRYTLIPDKYRTLLHREYHIRAISIFLLALAVAFAIGACSLFPAFMTAWLADMGGSAALVAAKDGQGATSLADIKHELVSDAALVAMVSANAVTTKPSDIIGSIIAGSSAVSITSLDLNRQASSTVVATITGTASTRDDLLSWKSELEKVSPGAAVDLPIEELAKSDDIQFSIKLTEQLP